MKTLIYLFTILIIVTSCCRNIKCAGSNFNGKFRIVSTMDGSDLVFGPSRIYNKDQIRFYSISNQDTAYLEYKTIYSHNTDYDSILYVNFLPSVNTAYIQLSNGDIDTLTMTFKTLDGGSCCSDAMVIDNFRFNNTVDVGSNGKTLILMK